MEDFRDASGVTHGAAAHRLTDLATRCLDVPLHVLRTGDGGALSRDCEDDGIAFPQDATGAVEGQSVCRSWTARTVVGQADRTTKDHQDTDTPQGTCWCSSQTGETPAGEFPIAVGMPHAHVLAPLPSGPSPGVDEGEVHTFLAQHARR